MDEPVEIHESSDSSTDENVNEVEKRKR